MQRRRGKGLHTGTHRCTGARYDKTSKRGSRRNEEIGLAHGKEKGGGGEGLHTGTEASVHRCQVR